ncbi:MAG: HIT family protein [Holdemania massiliensis]
MHKINKALSELWLSDEQCDVCARLRQIQRHENPNFVAELSTGYVVLGDDQYIRGYTLFLCKQHAAELFELDPQFQAQFLKEMVLTAEAAAAVFHAEKMNYELLGIGKSRHMHWHLFPAMPTTRRFRVRYGGRRRKFCMVRRPRLPRPSVRHGLCSCVRKSSGC